MTGPRFIVERRYHLWLITDRWRHVVEVVVFPQGDTLAHERAYVTLEAITYGPVNLLDAVVTRLERRLTAVGHHVLRRPPGHLAEPPTGRPERRRR